MTDLPLECDVQGVGTEFSLEAGQVAVFILREVEPDAGGEQLLPPTEVDQLFEDTVSYWRRWLSKCVYTGRWRGMVERSALVLKLLTYAH